MLQHYKEEYGPEVQKLRDENVQLKAKVAYLQQKNAELSELLRQASMTGHSETGPAATPPTSPVVGPPSNVSLYNDMFEQYQRLDDDIFVDGKDAINKSQPFQIADTASVECREYSRPAYHPRQR